MKGEQHYFLMNLLKWMHTLFVMFVLTARGVWTEQEPTGKKRKNISSILLYIP